MRIRDQLKEADLVSWDSFGDSVDKFFEGDMWQTEQPPHQEYPEEIAKLLIALDRLRPSGWLEMDSHLRNLSGDARTNLSKVAAGLKDTLDEFPMRRLLFGDEHPLQLWICRTGQRPSQSELQYQAEVGCLAANASKILVLYVAYDMAGDVVDLSCRAYSAPSVIQTNYPELKREAEKQRARYMKLEPSKPKKKKKNR
jgi:hypothetical protein